MGSKDSGPVKKHAFKLSKIQDANRVPWIHSKLSSYQTYFTKEMCAKYETWKHMEGHSSGTLTITARQHWIGHLWFQWLKSFFTLVSSRLHRLLSPVQAKPALWGFGFLFIWFRFFFFLVGLLELFLGLFVCLFLLSTVWSLWDQNCDSLGRGGEDEEWN